MDAIQISSSRRFCSVIVKQLPRLRFVLLYRGGCFILPRPSSIPHLGQKKQSLLHHLHINQFFFTTFFYLEKKCRSLVFLKVENKHYTYFLEEEELKLMSHPRRLDVHLLLLFWKVTFFFFWKLCFFTPKYIAHTFCYHHLKDMSFELFLRKKLHSEVPTWCSLSLLVKKSWGSFTKSCKRCL